MRRHSENGECLYTLSGETFNLKGRGIVYTAQLNRRATRDELHELIGQKLYGTPSLVITGVEMQCMSRFVAGTGIGLLVKTATTAQAPGDRHTDPKESEQSETND